ncbi:ATP-binding protein [Variovorax saccharolyticus]|uniref:ATP-binding protein n=1 Tax=Variovorax saccharolyticus TaxID=3053516 RepID=UPI0025759787|nr:winged helix-turn-helix domain-containing protein [Variovorax sp. J22R187]MDM0019478.1 winged helix-turn-helix domain-containing protein [Variovorax sp. J22R187]
MGEAAEWSTSPLRRDAAIALLHRLGKTSVERLDPLFLHPGASEFSSMNEFAARTGATVTFGPFTLRENERLLTRDGVPVELGGRAMDVLIVLVARANEVVSKHELMRLAWPGVVVSDGSLRFQITMLRQALDDGKDGARYIVSIVGRGYCFVAAISRQGGVDTANPAEPVLPGQPLQLVGRETDLSEIRARLATSRFVTIVGSGGVGKTTVAVRTGHDLLAMFGNAVYFIDLAALSDASLVPTAIASTLRLSVRSSDPVPSLLAYLRDKRMLLVLDNCEHVIDAAALLAERIFAATPHVHILATSREPLRTQDEHVHRLEPLASPPDEPGLTAAGVLTYPAAWLFVARAGASGAMLGLDDADAQVVAGICRKLDGVPLSIELAARRVVSYGLHQTATLLNDRLTLSWPGQRTARPRHQTLQATLDWSFELLDGAERQVLCQLPVFVGNFSLEAARRVVVAPALSEEQVLAAIASLAEKSLLAVHRSGARTLYRLLESTRVYALSKAGPETTEAAALRHASYFCHRLEQGAEKDAAFSRDAGRASDTADLGNVRAALEWCFGPQGATELGVALAAAAVPAFMAMSLLAECHRWSARALGELTERTVASRSEMTLQAALGLSQMFTRGNSEEVRHALERSLAVAQELGDAASQVQLLARLQIFHERIGDFVVSLDYAHRSAAVAETIDDPTARATANSLVGLCSHLTGDQAKARLLLEAAIAGAVQSTQASTIYSGFDHANRASIALARTLWLQGYPAQAVIVAQRAVDDARQLDHPVTLCIALIWAVSVYLWVGDLDRAERDIDSFIAYAESHSLTPYLAVGRGIKGELALRRGDTEHGVQALERCLGDLHESRYELLTTSFRLTLAEGLTMVGRTAEALGLIDDTLASVHANGDLCHLPELLRVKARALRSAPERRIEEAEECLVQSLDWSRRQGARGWELRTAMDLARQWSETRRAPQGQALLRGVLAHYAEGFDTADLQEAGGVLAHIDEMAASAAPIG